MNGKILVLVYVLTLGTACLDDKDIEDDEEEEQDADIEDDTGTITQVEPLVP